MRWFQRLVVWLVTVPLWVSHSLRAWAKHPQVLALTIAGGAIIAWACFALHTHNATRWLQPLAYQPARGGPSLIARDVLEKGVTQFYLRFGRMPNSWADFDEKQIIQGVPTARTGKQYVLDVTQMALIEAEETPP